MGFGQIKHTIQCDRPNCDNSVDMELPYDSITMEVKGKINRVPLNWAKTEVLGGGFERVLCPSCLEDLRQNWYYSLPPKVNKIMSIGGHKVQKND